MLGFVTMILPWMSDDIECSRSAKGRGLASASDVTVRVVRQPVGALDGVSLRRFRPGLTYDLDSSVADYLVVQGFAIVERRRSQRSQRARPNDRRSFTQIIEEVRDGK